MYWISAIWERTGDFKVAAECAREVWFKHGDTITPLCAEACKIDVKTVHDVHKAIMMMPDAGTKSRNHPNLTQSIDMHQTSEHENHHRAWCDSCMWLTTMEELGQEEHIEFLCSVLCQPVYANYVRSLLPGVKVTALKTPPRKSKGEVPVCEWEAVLEK